MKSQKVVANGVATQAGVLQSDQRIGRRGRRQKTSNKVVGPSESTGKERESETLRSNGDVETKTLRQLQAEEDEEEKFQADLKKAVRQSLGSFPTIPAYLLYQPLGLFASVHSCLLSDSAFSPSQDTFFYFRCQ
ncbi:PREDICTED: uncharacterized protein LOC106321934, partial [Brassica oleracea var. oleracea]|uniref:uncharacterized protein LOC106321934 n=1 Tax=Brassica oleracea var. oleracea TaxID=109376 RepID=UPI0006A6A849